jgi:hypothetical protein
MAYDCLVTQSSKAPFDIWAWRSMMLSSYQNRSSFEQIGTKALLPFRLPARPPRGDVHFGDDATSLVV